MGNSIAFIKLKQLDVSDPHTLKNECSADVVEKLLFRMNKDKF